LFKTLESIFMKRPEVGQFDKMKRDVKFWAGGGGEGEKKD
jgi:hypothetical protein